MQVSNKQLNIVDIVEKGIADPEYTFVFANIAEACGRVRGYNTLRSEWLTIDLATEKVLKVARELGVDPRQEDLVVLMELTR